MLGHERLTSIINFNPLAFFPSPDGGIILSASSCTRMRYVYISATSSLVPVTETMNGLMVFLSSSPSCANCTMVVMYSWNGIGLYPSVLRLLVSSGRTSPLPSRPEVSILDVACPRDGEKKVYWCVVGC